MKTLVDTLYESMFSGSSFNEEVRYKKSDWDAWKKHAPKDFEITELDKNLFGIYLNDKHIGTYDLKHEILMCNDTKLFGN